MKRFINLFLVFTFVFCWIVGTATPFFKDAEAAENNRYASSLNESIVVARGGTLVNTIEEKIEYAFKIEDKYFNEYELPAYVSKYSCGINAGGNVIGYYDRVYDELIPNHTGKIIWGKYFYASHDAEIEKMFDSLYSAMGATSEGVTLDGYLTGLKSYSSSKGRTASFTSAMYASALNSSVYKPAISSGKLLSVFLNGFSIIDFGNFRTYANYDTVKTYVHYGLHIMIAYGYYDVSYYNSEGQCFRKDCYLYVSTGYPTPSLSLLKINQYCYINDCYISEIY